MREEGAGRGEGDGNGWGGQSANNRDLYIF